MLVRFSELCLVELVVTGPIPVRALIDCSQVERVHKVLRLERVVRVDLKAVKVSAERHGIPGPRRRGVSVQALLVNRACTRDLGTRGRLFRHLWVVL